MSQPPAAQPPAALVWQSDPGCRERRQYNRRRKPALRAPRKKSERSFIQIPRGNQKSETPSPSPEHVRQSLPEGRISGVTGSLGAQVGFGSPCQHLPGSVCPPSRAGSVATQAGMTWSLHSPAPQHGLTFNQSFLMGTRHGQTSTPTHTNTWPRRPDSCSPLSPSFVPGMSWDPVGVPATGAALNNFIHTHKNT